MSHGDDQETYVERTFCKRKAVNAGATPVEGPQPESAQTYSVPMTVPSSSVSLSERETRLNGSERYHDSGLPLATEVYGFLDALDVTWSTFEVDALTEFIQARLQSERETLIAERDEARAAEEVATRAIMKDAAERERPRIQLAAAEAEVTRLSSQLQEAQEQRAIALDIRALADSEDAILRNFDAELDKAIESYRERAYTADRLSSQLAGLRTAILTLRTYAEKRNAHMLYRFKPGGVVGYSDMVDGLNALLPDADIMGWARDPRFDTVRAALAASQARDTTTE